MKITWASNAPWAPTGYGTQTAQMLKRLKADGHEVAVAANYGLQAHWLPDPESGAPVMPMGIDTYGNDVIRAHHQMWTRGEPSWIISLYDVWVYDQNVFADANIACWAPVDHYPVPPKVADWCKKHPTIAMSRFGEQAFKDAGIDVMYAPHGIELDVFKPTAKLPDGNDVRTVLNIPQDAFLVMINAANKGNVPPRKAWGEMLTAVAHLMREHEDVYLYIHTITGTIHGGIDLVMLMHALGINPERVRIPDQYAMITGLVSPAILAAHYSTADVLLATSMGEGFGIPVIEAQACGLPVIVTDFSAQPELVGAGWRVAWQDYWDFTQASGFAMPIIRSVVDALEQSYERRGDERMKAQAIEHAAKYDADKVYAEHWRPILARLEEMLKPKAVNRATRRRNTRKKAA